MYNTHFMLKIEDIHNNNIIIEQNHDYNNNNNNDKNTDECVEESGE